MKIKAQLVIKTPFERLALISALMGNEQKRFNMIEQLRDMGEGDTLTIETDAELEFRVTS